MAREPVASSTRPQKHAHDSLDRKAEIKEAASTGWLRSRRALPPARRPSSSLRRWGQQRLEQRMRAELDAVRTLHRKAVLLCRGGGAAVPDSKGDARFSAAAGPRREALSDAAAKRSKTSPMTKPAARAAHRIRPVKQQQQQLPSQRVVAATPLRERKIKKTTKDVEERRRRKEEEEIARAREECRRLVLAMEKSALLDETVYRHELEELGIAPFEYASTRTRSPALSQDRILVGVAY
ncbi:unnamed protein product [Urochloa decumbens]|uniref:Uncharacterized protein n=1 Tax=Urochloa decumbens TaxID=240449 RepID=A0ABC8VF53_9POAL